MPFAAGARRPSRRRSGAVARQRRTHCTDCITCTTGAALTPRMNRGYFAPSARPPEGRPGAPERCTDGKSRIHGALCRRGKTKHPEHCTDERNHPSPPARPKKILYPLPQTLLFRRRRNNSRPVIGFGRTRSHQGRHPDAPQARRVRQSLPCLPRRGKAEPGGCGGNYFPRMPFLPFLSSCVFCLLQRVEQIEGGVADLFGGDLKEALGIGAGDQGTGLAVEDGSEFSVQG